MRTYSQEVSRLSRRVAYLTTSRETYRLDQVKLEAQYEKAMEELKLLRQICNSSQTRSQQSNSSATAGPVDAISDTITSTSFRFRFKRNLQEFLRSTVPMDSPGVDSDIDVFPLAVKQKKSKGKGKEVPSASAELESRPMKAKPTCTLAAIIDLAATGSGTQQTCRNVNDTRTSDSAENEFLDIDDDQENLRIRRNVPGAPLPSTLRIVKYLQKKSLNPVLGGTSRQNPKS